jgi:hypothetical protein
MEMLFSTHTLIKRILGRFGKGFGVSARPKLRLWTAVRAAGNRHDS